MGLAVITLSWSQCFIFERSESKMEKGKILQRSEQQLKLGIKVCSRIRVNGLSLLNSESSVYTYLHSCYTSYVLYKLPLKNPSILLPYTTHASITPLIPLKPTTCHAASKQHGAV